MCSQIITPTLIVPWQWSQYQAQNYLYSDEQKYIVMVGSSVSMALAPYINENDSMNATIAFQGENALKGVHLINVKGRRDQMYPRYVLIEVPTIKYIPNSFSDQILYNPLLFELRDYFCFLRDGYQPIPILIQEVQKMLPFIIPFNYQFGIQFLNPTLQSIKQESVPVKPLLNENIFDNLSPKVLLDKKNHSILEKKITTELNELIENDVTLIFFYPPNRKDKNTPNLNSVECIINKYYPADRYPRVINHPDSGFVNINDGIHLPDHSIKFGNYLIKSVDSIIQGN